MAKEVKNLFYVGFGEYEDGNPILTILDQNLNPKPDLSMEDMQTWMKVMNTIGNISFTDSGTMRLDTGDTIYDMRIGVKK